MVYLEVFEDKRWVQYIFHLFVNVSPRNVIYTALSVSLLANLVYWQNESITLLHIFKRKMKFCNLLLFITGITRIIKHFLKHKVVIFAEFLKHICERAHFSRVRGLTACNFSNNEYFHRFSKILLILIRYSLQL